MCLRFDERVVQGLVVPFPVVAEHELGHGTRRCFWPKGIIGLRHSSLIDRTKRSAYAFRFGLLGGNLTTFTPADRVPQIPQRPFNPTMAPRDVLTRHSGDQSPNGLPRSRPPHSSLATAVILPGDQLSIPSQNRLRRDKRLDPHQHAPPQHLAPDSQTTPLVIGATDPLALESANLRPSLAGRISWGILSPPVTWRAIVIRPHLPDICLHLRDANEVLNSPSVPISGAGGGRLPSAS